MTLSIISRQIKNVITRNSRINLILACNERRNYGEKRNLEVCTVSECMVDPRTPEPKVVIIGAGMAGLSAAQRLIQCGINNFQILEATDRPGGRIHSCWLGDVIAEMGAQYIKGGCAANPIYNLACQEGLLRPPVRRRDPFSGLFCTSDGRAIDLPVSITAYHTFRQIEQEAAMLPGGRIHSCWLGDVIAEMGAQYIKGGCAANPIYNLACQEGLLRPPVRRRDPFSGLFCTSDGRAIDLPVSITAYHTFRQIEQEAAMLFNMGSGREHGTMLHFLGIRIQQELNNFPEDQRYDAARVMYGLTNAVRKRCGDDLSLVSADQYGSYIAIPGGKIRIPLGFVGVIAPLLRDLPPCCLHYCKPIHKINWGTINKPGERAKVKCCDGEQFAADYVIITCSLGVLKEHADNMFSPKLPADKIDAIKCLGYGNVNKIYLEYARPFWVWNEGGIKFAWSPDELKHRKDWVKGLNSVEEVEGSKQVLCAYVAGPEACQMELVSDEEVAAGITSVLRQFTGDSTLPYPTTILRSKWGTDPYFCGAYSYMAMESTVGHQCDLSAPLPGCCEPEAPVLLFAGEATCVGHYSTVHGARLSGIREAERIIQLTKKYGGPPPPSTPAKDNPCSSSIK